MSNTPSPTTELERITAAGNALAALVAALPPSAPVAIVARTFREPFETEVHIKPEDLPPGAVVRKNTSVGERMEIDLGAVGGTAIVNKVTPEQLLAVVASIIATSKDATTACQRIRAEVSGWKFQGADGTIA
jgi:hypothetical protein